MEPVAIADEDTAQGDRASAYESDLPWIFAGRYEIRALLGAGGMGSVYAAIDRELDDVVAVKMMRSELLVDPGIVERFRREVRLARRITHPNVVRVYDLGAADGTRYLTMERIVGRSLGDLIDQEGVLEPVHLLRLAREIAGGLAAAHRAGVIHRDLKPDNVVVEDEGRAVLTDFGIARPLSEAAGEVTLSGIGTPAYMAPELFGTLPAADAPCDVFSLGCMLFEAATGRLPFPGETHGELVEARLRADAPDARTLRPELPAELSALIARCLARNRAARFDSAIAVAAAAAALPDEGEPEPVSIRPRHLTSRRRDETPAALSSPSRSSAKSVAVLPFVSSDDDEHLAGGLHEAIIGGLTQIAALRVRPRGRVAAYRGKTVSRVEIARQLDARVLVEGALERRGPRVVVAVRTFGAIESFPLWSARFECDVSGIAALADTVSAGIADALAVARPLCVEDARPEDPRVAELVMRARHAYHGFWQPHAAQAVALFDEALALDPDHPGALSGRCLAALRLGLFTSEGLAVAREAANRASEIAPDSSQVRIARAAIALQDGDVVAAVTRAKRAVLASPELAEAQALLGRILLEADLVPEAIRHLEWAIALEPELWLARWDLTRAHALSHDWDAVTAAEELGDDTRVGRWLDRARYALWRRDPEGARRHLAALPADIGGPIGLARDVLEIAAGTASSNSGKALQIFRRQGAASARQRAFVAQIDAEIAAYEGRRAESLGSIAEAADAGLTDLAWLMRCPLLEPLRASPPFAIVVRHVGTIAARVREALYEE